MRIGARFEDMVRSAAEGGGMYHPDMGDDFVDAALAHHRAPAEDQEFRIADGRWIRVRENALPSGGRVLLTSDITAQKAAQVELEEREQLLRRIADAIPLPIVITRISQPEVLFANELADRDVRPAPRARSPTPSAAPTSIPAIAGFWSSSSIATGGSTDWRSACAAPTGPRCGRSCRRARSRSTASWRC